MTQKPKAFGTGSGAEQRDQRLKQALKSNLAKRKAQAKAKAGKPVETAASARQKGIKYGFNFGHWKWRFAWRNSNCRGKKCLLNLDAGNLAKRRTPDPDQCTALI
jgi:hypothetical protein